jgi:basic amino acid/polyamine antiporter, APA family
MKVLRKKSVQNILRQSSLEEAANENGLKRHLGVRDLTAFGIAAIIGAGIFSTIGQASSDGGPGVVFLFLFTAIACGFAAFCYAEFASMVPVSGSAYTYSYVAFGELFAWIIGWALIMEYGIGNITVAISWSDYFTGLLGSMGVHLPEWMTMDYLSASSGYHHAEVLMHGGKTFTNLDPALQSAWQAYAAAPNLFGFHLVADLPALLIIVIITWLVFRGIRESRNASNMMVVVKLAIVLLVIAVGIFYVDTDNWSPFMPNGIGGVLKGVSAVFFAYIGFDAISTTAEECKNPQRDLPRGMMWAIIICTVLYIAIALVLTGMVRYDLLAVGDPLAFVFEKLNLKWMSGIIAVSAVFAMASVLLVFQLGQPRIWMSMSRDGLLPPAFARIHPRYNTPSFATIVTGFVVAVPALFMNLTMVTDLCSIGTLFAFVLVCGGVLVLEQDKELPRGKFKTPYFNARYFLPVILIAILLAGYQMNRGGMISFLENRPEVASAADLAKSLTIPEVKSLKAHLATKDLADINDTDFDLEASLSGMDHATYLKFLEEAPIAKDKKFTSGWSLFKHKIPMWIFIIVTCILLWFSVTRQLSLIPVMGVLSCLYMMAQIKLHNWIGFTIWLLIGLVIYSSYGYKHSKLARRAGN